MTTIIERHEIALKRANAEIARKKEEIKNSRYRLHYHFMPPTGWMNDPNGFIQYKGEYHLFYQFYPYHSQWGPMHWGHAKSKDLVQWEHLPVALAPSESYDSADIKSCGCFSGSAVAKGEKLILFYTGHVDTNYPPQVQCMATSTDGVQFNKYENNPLIKDIPTEASQDFRDPKVWKHEDLWYMVLGTKKEDKGKVALYVSEDLIQWKYKGIAAESNGTQGDTWECPDLFPIGETHALLVSPIHEEKHKNPFYLLGDMDYEAGKFTEQFAGILDYGLDFYAPQTLVDDQGRRIMMGWMEKWLTKMPSQSYGWAGAMGVPRELILDGSKLIQRPIPELKQLRTNYQKRENLIISESEQFKNHQLDVSELSIVIATEKTTASKMSIWLRCSDDQKERTELIIDFKMSEIIMNRQYSGCGEITNSKAPFQVKEDGMLSIQIFMDTSSIELFINEGEQVMTNRIFPNETSKDCYLQAENGSAEIKTLETWDLKSS